MFRQVMVDNITRLKVQELFERQTPEAGAQLGDLRQEVPKSCPGLREEYKWDVPYYCTKKSPAYLNVRKGAVEAGFTPNSDRDPALLRALLAQAAQLAQE